MNSAPNLLCVLTAIAAVACVAPAVAQPSRAKNGTAQTAPAPATPAPAATPGTTSTAPEQPGWAARCSSNSRTAPLECAIEASAIIAKTGQVVVLVNIRVPSDAHNKPVATVQLPLGLFLPAGMKFQVDDGKVTDIPIQTCEARGCYATAPLEPDLIAALRSGGQLKVSFENLAREPISVPMPLKDFAAVYDKIK